MKFEATQQINYKIAKIILIVHSLNLVSEFVYVVQIVLQNVQVPIFFNVLSDLESK